MPHQNDQSCIDACNACAIACNHCAASCLQEQDVKMKQHAVDNITSHFLSRGGLSFGFDAGQAPKPRRR